MMGRSTQLGYSGVLRAGSVCCVAFGLSSCIPLVIGAAAGYIAREEGVGVVKPHGSGGSPYVDPPTYEETEAYDEPYAEGGYDEPVY